VRAWVRISFATIVADMPRDDKSLGLSVFSFQAIEVHMAVSKLKIFTFYSMEPWQRRDLDLASEDEGAGG